jgi:hypothetical protein
MSKLGTPVERTRASAHSRLFGSRSAMLPRVLSAVALCSALVSAPSEARPKDDDEGGGTEPNIGCLGNVTGSLTVSPASIRLGESATLRYQASVPSNCSAVRLTLSGETLAARSGTRTVSPSANATYRLTASRGNASVSLGSASVQVGLPQRVVISRNDQAALLVQALGIPNTEVVLQDHVDLDLSHRAAIFVASGVQLLGGRTPQIPGARVRTSTRPAPLFAVGGDDVRISGIRIEGPDMGVSESEDKAVAIGIESQVDIEVDNNEISGFSGSGVSVEDSAGRIHATHDFDAIHVHDNFIHHNQSLGRHGYGVVVGDGGYVLIERNVFDWNRHAIAGDGSDGSGFRAYRNLVLEHGGLHRWIPFPGTWIHTHQFDMHGQDSCGVGDIFSDTVFNCGTAGHDMDIRFNAFLYTDDEAFKLRGTPQIKPYGAHVVSNVFAHDSVDDALDQTESGLYESDNLADINGMDELRSCDFDGDGRQDSFLATGQTWWYASSTTGPWTFLNQSQKRAAQVELGFFDGDARCDVRTDGVVYPGGMPTGGLPPICTPPTFACASGCCTSPPPREPTCYQSCLESCRSDFDMLPRQCVQMCRADCAP